MLSNLTSTSFKTWDEQEIAGYAETIDLVYQSYEDLHLTENYIRQLHQQLLRHSHKDERHRGEYKTLPNHVVAKDANGKEIGVVFETSSPFDTPREMEELISCTTKAIFEVSMHHLLIIAVFNVVFLAIHPFQDGNGRLSRILITLMLLRAGYNYVPYTSLENVVEENKERYYKALRRTQTSLKHDLPDWDPWIRFFLRCLKKQKTNLAEKLEKGPDKLETDLATLSLKIVKLLNINERLTIAEIVKLTGANQNTLKVRLRELVNNGRLKHHGKARATWYSL